MSIKKTVVDEKTGEVTEKEESSGINEYNDYNLMYLNQAQNWANIRLKLRGYSFCNEVNTIKNNN